MQFRYLLTDLGIVGKTVQINLFDYGVKMEVTMPEIKKKEA